MREGQQPLVDTDTDTSRDRIDLLFEISAFESLKKQNRVTLQVSGPCADLRCRVVKK